METRIIDMYNRFRAWQLDPNPVKSSSEGHICHGCGNAYKGNFCPVCGQENDRGQADWMLLLIPVFYFIAYRQLLGYGVWGTFWRTLLCLGSILYFFGIVMMVRMHLSNEFWEGVSAIGFIGMIIAFLAIGAGILFLGWWISKKTEKRRL